VSLPLLFQQELHEMLLSDAVSLIRANLVH
jgi:hypothetical protein